MSEGIAWTLGALAVCRISHLLWAEDGPGGVVLRLRRRAGSGWFGELLDCFYCLSVWVALPVAGLILSVHGGVWTALAPVGWLGLSGAAILIERLNPLTRASEATETSDEPGDRA